MPAPQRGGHRRRGGRLDHQVVHARGAAPLALAAHGGGGEGDDRGAAAGRPRTRAGGGRARSRRRREQQVAEHEPVAGGGEALQRFLGALGGVGDEAERLELAGEDLAVDGVVLDEQNDAALALGVVARRQRPPEWLLLAEGLRRPASTGARP